MINKYFYTLLFFTLQKGQSNSEKLRNEKVLDSCKIYYNKFKLQSNYYISIYKCVMLN